MFTSEFHPGMKRVEFRPGMKFTSKKNLPLSMKTYKKFIIRAWYVKTSDGYIFRKVTFVCVFSYKGISEAVAQKCSVKKTGLQLY